MKQITVTLGPETFDFSDGFDPKHPECQFCTFSTEDRYGTSCCGMKFNCPFGPEFEWNDPEQMNPDNISKWLCTFVDRDNLFREGVIVYADNYNNAKRISMDKAKKLLDNGYHFSELQQLMEWSAMNKWKVRFGSINMCAEKEETIEIEASTSRNAARKAEEKLKKNMDVRYCRVLSVEPISSN